LSTWLAGVAVVSIDVAGVDVAFVDVAGWCCRGVIRNMYAHIPQRGEGRRLRVVTIKYINKRRTYEQSWWSSGVEKCEGEDGR